jgi:hypothetical protein
MSCAWLPHLARLLAESSRAADERAVMNAWVLFGSIAILLGVFVLFVALLAVIRRQRRVSPTRSKGEGTVVDPWAEAGQRVRPYPESDQRR